MSRVVKSIWKPIRTLFTRPKKLFDPWFGADPRELSRYTIENRPPSLKRGNWIADLAIPIMLGAAGPAGPALATGYGAWRGYQGGGGVPGAVTGGAKGYLTGGLGGTLGRAAGYGTPEMIGSQVGFRTSGVGIGQQLATGARGYLASTPFMGAGGVVGAGGPAAPGVGTAGGAGAAWPGVAPGVALATGAAAASLGAKPPDLAYRPTGERFEEAQNLVLQKYLGEAARELPTAIQEEYLGMIRTPLGQLYPVEKDARWARINEAIETSYADYEEGIKARYAQAGGLGSSDYKEELRNARADKAREMGQARAELEQSLYETQIKIKQDALTRAAQQGQFDTSLAFELAKAIQMDDQLEMAVETQDYDAFQRVMGAIMALGVQSAMPSVSSLGG